MATATLSAFVTPAARAEPLEVIHWWTSGSESKAVQVFAQEFDKRGGKWVDDAVVGGDAAQALALSRIAGNNPPGVIQWNAGAQVGELAKQGVLRNLDADAIAGHWRDHLPPLALQSIEYDGHIYAVPTDIHGNNWLFTSPQIFAKVGVQPPKTWDEFFTAAEKIKAAGYVAFAQGGEPWQEFLLFNTVMIGVMGKDDFRRVFIDHDGKVAAGPGMVKAFDTYRRITAYVDQGSSGRKWNDTAMMVANGKAAMQIMGDWAKGEFIAAGLQPGSGFGCQMAPGNEQAYQLVIDVFTFPKIANAQVTQAQDTLANVMMDPAVQVQFNRFKGAIPPRLDADIGVLDQCTKLGKSILSDSANQVPNAALAFNNDVAGQLTDVVSQFWTNPSVTSQQATHQFAAIIGQIGQ